jgi:hypothetical protein
MIANIENQAAIAQLETVKARFSELRPQFPRLTVNYQTVLDDEWRPERVELTNPGDQDGFDLFDVMAHNAGKLLLSLGLIGARDYEHPNAAFVRFVTEAEGFRFVASVYVNPTDERSMIGPPRPPAATVVVLPSDSFGHAAYAVQIAIDKLKSGLATAPAGEAPSDPRFQLLFNEMTQKQRQVFRMLWTKGSATIEQLWKFWTETVQKDAVEKMISRLAERIDIVTSKDGWNGKKPVLTMKAGIATLEK